MARVTVRSLQKMKDNGEKLTMLATYDYYTAAILDQAGVDLLLVGDTLGMAFGGKETTLSVLLDHVAYHAEIVSRAAKRAMVIGDMPFLTYQVNCDQAVANAGRLMQESHVHGGKLEGGRSMIPVVKRILQAGIPVMGHVGLTPQAVNVLGGYAARGWSDNEAEKIVGDAVALDQAGAFAIVIEGVVEPIAITATKAVSCPTIGIGASAKCDGQVLVTEDMLGMFERVPRFVKRYEDIAGVIDKTVAKYAEEVRERSFPSEDQTYRPKD